MTKVLLYSNGMDSWLISELWKPDVKLYVNMSTSYSDVEIAKLPKDVKIVDFPLGQFEEESKFIPMRNLYLLMIASNYGDEICLGATAGDWGSKDKTPEFLDRAEDMINYLLGKQSKVEGDRHIHICRDFIYKFKTDLVNDYLEQGGDIRRIWDESFSCFTPVDGRPCLHCKPCFRKFTSLAGYGCTFTEDERRRIWEYCRSEIVPRSKCINATYYSERGEEGRIAEKVVRELYDEFGGDINADEQS